MLKIINANKCYNKNQENEIIALENIDLEFFDKGLILICGESGCGKTTLLNCIGKFDSLDSGEIISNYDYKVSYIFQDFQLISDMSVYDNLKLVCDINDLEYTKIDEALEMLNIIKYKKHFPNQLSGGQKQRVAIARALLTNNPIILADEPTGSLDKKNSLEIAKVLFELSKERLIIVASHDVDLFSQYADRIIRLEDGKIVENHERNKDLIISSNQTLNGELKKEPKLSLKACAKIDLKSFKKSKTKVLFLSLTMLLSLLLIMISLSIVFNDNDRTFKKYLDDFNVERVDYFSNFDGNIEDEIRYVSIDEKTLSSVLELENTSKVFFNDASYILKLNDNDSFNDINKIYLSNRYKEIAINTNEVVITDFIRDKIKEEYNLDILNKKIKIREIELEVVGIIDTNYKNKNHDNLYTDYIDNDCKVIYINEETFNILENDIPLTFKCSCWLNNNRHRMNLTSNSLLVETDLIAGTSEISSGEIILEEFKAKALFKDSAYEDIIGNTITMEFRKYYLSTLVENKDYKIVGISKNTSYIDDEDYKYIYQRFCEENFDYYVNQGISIENPSLEQLKFLNRLDLFHNTYISQSFYDSIYTLKTFSILFLIVGVVALIICILILMNYMSSSMINKKREIGVLKSLYISNYDISKLFLIEIMIISIVSYVIGSILIIFVLNIFNCILVDYHITLISFINYNLFGNLILFLVIALIIYLYNLISFKRLNKKSTIDLVYER